jgi:hypothetical protein
MEEGRRRRVGVRAAVVVDDGAGDDVDEGKVRGPRGLRLTLQACTDPSRCRSRLEALGRP